MCTDKECLSGLSRSPQRDFLNITAITTTKEDPTSTTFASLSVRNYRYYATGALISNIGTWVGRVTQDWVVLTELTHHDAVSLGVVTALQFAPVILFAPMAGTLADTYPKRRLLMLSQSALAVTSFILAILLLTHSATLMSVFLLALLQGVATALDNPTRQSFVSELVPQENLTNAVGLNSASFNTARLIGPGVAGLLIAGVGTGVAMVLNALSFVAVLIALVAMKPAELYPAPRRAGRRGGVREGLAYVKGRRDLQLVMGLVFMLGTFGMNFQITTALMATTVFHADARAYGVISSIMAIGSLSAALLAARRKEPSLRLLLLALSAFAVFSGAAALAPNVWWFGIFLVPVGLSAMTALTTANTTVQLSVAPELRGRVMALYMSILMGGTPFGAPLIGWIGNTWGPRWTILVGTFAVGGATLAAIVLVMRMRDYSPHDVLAMRPSLHTHDEASDADELQDESEAVRESQT